MGCKNSTNVNASVVAVVFCLFVYSSERSEELPHLLLPLSLHLPSLLPLPLPLLK
jgi:hypothetical protein